MDIGPLQLVVVAFDNPAPDGSVLGELLALADQDAIRLVDLLAVHRSADGELTTLEASGLDLDEAMAYGAWVGALIGLGAAGEAGMEAGAFEGALLAETEYEYGLDEEALATISADIPPGGAALVAAIEHRWAIPLRNATRAQGGIVVAQDFLNPESLIALGAVAGAELID